jgi:hypothetical protein
VGVRTVAGMNDTHRETGPDSAGVPAASTTPAPSTRTRRKRSAVKTPVPKKQKPVKPGKGRPKLWPPAGGVPKDDAVAVAIDEYEFQCLTPAEQRQLGPFLRATAYRIRLEPRFLSFMARHVQYQVATYGMELEASRLFGQYQVEDTLTHAATKIWSTRGSQMTARWALRKIGRAAHPTGWPAKPKSIKDQPTEPYTAEEVNRLLRRARNLPKDYQRTRLMGILLLGLGAGLDGKDIPWVRGSHVFVGERGVWVHVHTKGRERRVPVLQRFEEELLALSVEVGDDRFIGDGEPKNNSYLSAFASEMLLKKKIEPRVNAHRMRAT